ncbi:MULTISPECIES: alanine--tRNA ligase [unclassified Thermosynechococcus]|uniref:alanine--tRNA ligase n=1 Tax=unclassified Thermosynechococcus TaxID=2622553 RepID=UPI00287319E6|nr:MULTISPECIES: alanine--tRNA ligase [unclassified Thermosynechococcus]WNC21610.1 alanine--tRNA ligase [Thermosynechococcus sp. PP22]WNC31849.1 alanine--tRNA ligase [Thermosynechococcus sp. PKX95]WNC34376.1 alanine--tRNA ligase [Thermosynechococcus sp. PKX91]WNC36896.1 alanine--tRNA ligase [Thermosynechococcus sp. WL11]WNC39417.1 alanine--tRNA ligase [Thermosynechococcus sp. WL17]
MTSSPSASATIALTGDQIRQKFLEFYAAKGHTILPSASLIPEDPTVLLTIAGMLPFKPIFLGQETPKVRRVTTAQKCLRTNDIENVGRTARHHTFFEMLGNFSFGDYFKAEAIGWAWELMTTVYGLPPERLLVSVFENDDEAYDIWHRQVGLPKERIQRMGEESNFWTAGPTGPCGPCSEIYYDFYPEKGLADVDLDDDRRFIELYNLVFMELNQDDQGRRTPLKAKNIDTGMGLERMAQVLQGVPNNYETDLIFPMIEAAAQRAGIQYRKANASTKTSLKVIGDHTRAVVHLIADGVTASNVGRGYVLRRLIRRIVRHSRLLGINELVTPALAQVAIDLAANVYPNVRERQAVILSELQREEEQFLKTLDRGEKLLAEMLAPLKTTKGKKRSKPQLAGRDAFVLFDTYGFPLELTQEIAAEQGIGVDVAEFEACMAEQRQRSQAAHETIDITVQEGIDSLADQLHPTQFRGYDEFSLTTTVTAILVAGHPVTTATAGTEVQVILEETPFYAESGGQIGDRGYLATSDALVQIHDVQKQKEVFVHYGKVERGSLSVGDRVSAQIDLSCRRRVQAHHTATHLLQAALKKRIDENISQAGSLVAFDRLRFDFNCPRALTREELQQIEDQINTWISESHATHTSIMALNEAKAKGAIAMFGEKYGEQVRVLDIPGVSMELCGGTHVHNTAEIGLFKIISESGVAAGIRRIEAIAGPAVRDYLQQRDSIVRELCDRFKAKPEEILDRISQLQADLKAQQKELEHLKAELALAKTQALLEQAEAIGATHLLIASLAGVDPQGLKTAAEWLLNKLGSGAVVLATQPAADKVNLLVAASPDVVERGVHAGQLVAELAQVCGGRGGGRPNFAQAGGSQPQKLAEAFERARSRLQEVLEG